MKQKENAQRYDADRFIKKFNEQFPVGSTVMWRSVGMKEYPYKEYEVRTAAFTSSSGEPVTYVKGIIGYVSVLEDFVKY